MQPYLLPYIGYFQLINCVNEFVIYDDVQYIKGGWINRNRILQHGEVTYFTVPVDRGSVGDLIFEKCISVKQRPRAIGKILKTLAHSYSPSPYYSDVMPIIEEILKFESDSLSDYVSNSISVVCRYLSVSTLLHRSSRMENNRRDLKGEDRVIGICLERSADTYVNAIGGRELYNRIEFEEKGLGLYFLRTVIDPYSQSSSGFVPNLSIVDVLMNCGRERTSEMLEDYVLI
jgi:hypothetical protein